MKIAYLIPVFPQLSETFVSAEVTRLEALGLPLELFAFAGPAAGDRDRLSADAGKLAGRTRYLGRGALLRAALRHPLWLLRALRPARAIGAQSSLGTSLASRLLKAVAVADACQRLRVEHLHAHWPLATEVAWLVRRLTGCTLSVSVHAHEVAHEGGHFPTVFPDLSFAAFCNGGARDYLLATLPAACAAKTHLVYHGVDLSRFTARPLPPVAGALHVLSAGRLTRTKGFPALVRACAAARRAGVPVTLTICGRGAEEAVIRETAEAEGFSEWLELPGWVSHDEMVARIERSHLFALMASTGFHDGLPNVVLEAMACARPVVLSPLPAAGEAVSHGVEGFLLASDADEAGLVTALSTLYASPESLSIMGTAARTRVTRDHDAARQILRMQALFDGVATEQRT